MHTMKTDDILGCSFLLPPDENGETHCATVIQKVLDADSEELARPRKPKFAVKQMKKQKNSLPTIS